MRIAEEQERERSTGQALPARRTGTLLAPATGITEASPPGWRRKGRVPGERRYLRREHEYTGSVRVAMAPDGEAIAAWYAEER